LTNWGKILKKKVGKSAPSPPLSLMFNTFPNEKHRRQILHPRNSDASAEGKFEFPSMTLSH
jgi:hypothetical protein